MDALYVTDRASTVVLASLRESTVTDPVVGMGSVVVEVRSRAGTKAYREGATRQELLEIAMKEQPRGSTPMWKPVVYSRAEVPADCLLEAVGVVYCFPSMLIKQMTGWTLDYTDAESLVLLDNEGRTMLP